MDPIALPLNNAADKQIIDLNITPNGNAVSLRVTVAYFRHTDRWYMTVEDASSGECIASFIPLIASGNKYNDLLGQLGHKRIGSVFCVPLSDDHETADPAKDTLTDFEVVWMDNVVFED